MERVCIGRGTCITLCIGRGLCISRECVEVYALVGITPSSEKRRSGNARSVNARGAFTQFYMSSIQITTLHNSYEFLHIIALPYSIFKQDSNLGPKTRHSI